MAEAPIPSGLGEIGQDRLLDGRLVLRQPLKGHRAGSDAVLLAAALPDLGEGPLLDIGAGVGTVGLAAALAQPRLRVTLLERDPELAELARQNSVLNGLEARAHVATIDVTSRAAAMTAAGLGPARFACVAMNPPFFAAGRHQASPVANRRAAHVAEGAFETWLAPARRLLRPGGAVAIIHRAESLPELLAALAAGFGGVRIRPVHAVAERAAIRIIVTATLNGKGPAALLPALVLNGPDGRFTEFGEALHRGRATLRELSPGCLSAPQ